jgi:multiple sugar transport system substrate-binding protein
VVNNGVTTRWRALTVGAVAMTLLATACGGGEGSSGGDGVEITFSSWIGQEPTIKKMAEEFHKENPDITIKFQNVPAEESAQKLTTQIAGGNPPDAAFVDASTVAGFASRGALVNLDDRISKSDVVDPDDYVDAFKTFTTFEDSMYGLPFDGESTALFYRTDLFEAAGITAPPRPGRSSRRRPRS